MKVATWNVNGIRARHAQVQDWIERERPDAVCLQEIKASADPDLPFQALDYWMAVERHRKAGDFEANGYFKEVSLQNVPALLVMIAPLLSFHRSLDRVSDYLPAGVPLMQIGINQGWKSEIKVLRRKGALR